MIVRSPCRCSVAVRVRHRADARARPSRRRASSGRSSTCRRWRRRSPRRSGSSTCSTRRPARSTRCCSSSASTGRSGSSRPTGRSRRSRCSRIWGIGNTMVIFLAAVLDVPRHLYESAAARRRRPLAAAPLGDAAVDQPGDPVRRRHRRDRGRCSTSPRPTSRPPSRPARPRRPVTATRSTLGYPQDSTLFYPILLYQHGFRYFQHGLRVGDGDGPARRRVRADGAHRAQLAPVGPLPGAMR